MRHTATLLIGQDLKQFTARLGKYILKYGEANASSYFTAVTWLFEERQTEIKRVVRDDSLSIDFVSTMQDVYNTKLVEWKTLTSTDRDLDMRHFFIELHQSTVTINNPGDSNSLLLSLVVPLYDVKACEEATHIVNTISSIQSHYTINIIGLCESLGNIVSPEVFRDITAEREIEYKDSQKAMLQKLANLKLEQLVLTYLVILNNLHY